MTMKLPGAVLALPTRSISRVIAPVLAFDVAASTFQAVIAMAACGNVAARTRAARVEAAAWRVAMEVIAFIGSSIVLLRGTWASTLRPLRVPMLNVAMMETGRETAVAATAK